ncbi:hypothetical protein MMC18_001384 [Xylographa bjoerkii]|nr:hypothetical protein [Xylographa bjoerkii]
MYANEYDNLQITVARLQQGDSGTRIDEAAFTSFIVSLFPNAATPAGIGGPLLFDLVSYFANVPFCQVPPPPLTVDGLTRALALLIEKRNPLSHGARIGPRSLAELDPAALTEGVEESNDADSRYDSREDLIYNAWENQVYFIEVITQPDYDKPGIRRVPREAFKHIAEDFPRSPVHLNKLRLPEPKFQALVTLLFRPFCSGPATEEYASYTEEPETAVESLMLAFADGSSTHISWKSFNRTLAQSLPLLLDSLSVLCSCFVTPLAKVLQARRLLPQPGEIFNTASAQPTQFLPTTLAQVRTLAHDLQREQRRSKRRAEWCVGSQRVHLERTFCLASSPTDPAGAWKRFVLGAFIPTPWNRKDADFGSEDSSICQLRPVQEVFGAARSGFGVQHARLRNHVLVFGGEGSAVGGGDYESYFDAERSMPEQEEFVIEELEVWG